MTVCDKLMPTEFRTALYRFSTPFLETLRPYTFKDVIIGCVLFLAAFSVLASLSTEALSNGDAAMYLQNMQNLNFSRLSTHVGYYLLGAGVIRIFPGNDEYVMNLMNCLLGALSITLIYFITLIICRSQIAALSSSLFLLTHGLFLENAVYAEVYTPKTCFLLLAVVLWLLNRPLIAGLSFVFAFLITPSTILALPFFLVLRPRLRPILMFCTTTLVVAVIAVFPLHEEYLFGGRGLIVPIARTAFDLGNALHKEGREILNSLFLGIPFTLLGFVELFRQRRFQPFAVALLVLWAANLVFGERFPDVPVQLATYALLCTVSGIGLHLLLRVPSDKTYARITPGLTFVLLIGAVVVMEVTRTPAWIALSLPKGFVMIAVSCALICLIWVAADSRRRIRNSTAVACAVLLVVTVHGSAAFARINESGKYYVAYRDSVIEAKRTVSSDYLIIANWSQWSLFDHYVFGQWKMSDWIDSCDLSDCWGGGKELRLRAMRKLKEAVANRRPILLLAYYPDLLPFFDRSGYEIAPLGCVYVGVARD